MTFRDEMRNLFDAYAAAYRAGDAAGCAAVFVQDAELFSPFGPAARGRDAIERTHAERVQEGAEGKRIDVVGAGQSGNLGWCLARYSEGATTGEEVSLNVLERQEDGRWLIRMCSLNEG